MTSERSLEERLREMLSNIKLTTALLQPTPTTVLILWREGYFIGYTQYMIPNSSEIVFLNKTASSFRQYAVKIIRRLDPEIPTLEADATLDLRAENHVLIKSVDRLTALTEDQTAYVRQHFPDIYKIPDEMLSRMPPRN